MTKGTNLLKNVGLLTLGQFGTKILNLLLVPLYTYVLSTQEYGTYDLVVTTIGLMIPLFTLNIYDGAGRYSIANVLDRKQVLSVAMKWLLVGFVICAIFGAVAFLWYDAFGLRQYYIYYIIMFALTALSGVLTIYVRGLELIRTISISGVLSSLVIVALNIFFLLVLKLGLDGYFLANILGLFVQCLYMFFAGKLWNYLTTELDKKVELRMLRYSVPMIANTVSWWVNDLSDRLIVSTICGIAANGVYSVAYKIPAVMNMMSGIFSQAWTLSTVRDFDKDDKDGFFSRSYSLYVCMMVIPCSLLIVLDRPIARIMFSKDFYSAWMYVPPLLIAAVFGGLSGCIGAFFTAMEDARSFAQTSIIGAIVNILLNLATVPIVGPIGAAFATAISGFSIWIMRVYKIRKVMNVSINLKRDGVSILLLSIQALFLLFFQEETILVYAFEALVFCAVILLFRNEIINCKHYIVNLMNRKQGS